MELAKELREIPVKKRQELVDKLERGYRSLTKSMSSRGLGGAWADAYADVSADARREKGREGLLRIPDIRKELGLK